MSNVHIGSFVISPPLGEFFICFNVRTIPLGPPGETGRDMREYTDRQSHKLLYVICPVFLQGVKRQRSPSPPPTTSVYGSYPGGKYPASAYGGSVKPESYPPTGGVYGKAVKTGMVYHHRYSYFNSYTNVQLPIKSNLNCPLLHIGLYLHNSHNIWLISCVFQISPGRSDHLSHNSFLFLKLSSTWDKVLSL